MLNLILDYMKERGIERRSEFKYWTMKLNYEYSLQFMHRMISKPQYLDVPWCWDYHSAVRFHRTEVDWQCWGRG